MEKIHGTPHVLAVPYPSQGHINPMLQFCKRLVSKGVKASLAITTYIFDTVKPPSDGQVSVVTISDGYDEGGFNEAESVEEYIGQLKAFGSSSIRDIIEANIGTSHPINCLVYDSFLPWALDVAREHGIFGAAFFTQACTVNYVYYLFHHKKLPLSPVLSTPVQILALPPFEVRDLPSFLGSPGIYPAYLKLVLKQICNMDKADFVLVNTYYDLEDKVVDAMSKECRGLLTIGPTVPSYYLDNRINFDKDYELNLYKLDSAPSASSWLSNKPPRSVVYVSFGSMACLSVEQMEELAYGLKECCCNFLWVVRPTEISKLPKNSFDENVDKGLIVTWSPQLEVLASEAIGCFFTHCGWNSTLEALVLGVPMVGMPQWTDQPTDAKLVEDVWKVGVRVKVDENGVVKREEVVACINEVMVGEKRFEFVENAKMWKDLAKKAVCEGGSSEENICQFVSKISDS